MAGENFTAGLVDAGAVMAGFDRWSVAGTGIDLKWQCGSLEQYLAVTAPKVDVIFLTWRGKSIVGLAEAIRHCGLRAQYVVVAAEFPIQEIESLARRAGAAGVIRATTRWSKLFENAHEVLVSQELGGGSFKSKTGATFSMQEVAAIKLFKRGTPLLFIGDQVGKDSDWVVKLLAREGLRSA